MGRVSDESVIRDGRAVAWGIAGSAEGSCGRVRKLSSGWVWPGLRAGLFAALLSGVVLYLVLLALFRHLFTNTYDYMLAPILFVSHLSLILGCFGVASGLVWRAVFRLRRRRVLRDNAYSLCMATCIAGAAGFFAAAWVAFGVLPGEDASTVAGLLAVAAGAVGLGWVLYRGLFRRLLVALLPSSRGALALIILSAFGSVLGKSVRSEYLTERPGEYVQDIAGRGAGEVEESAWATPAEEGAAGGGADGRAASVEDERPSILLLTVDALRPDHLGCYGYSRSTSPYVDSLAAEGVLFTSAYAHRPKTSPSLAGILTGTYPQRHGVRRARQVLPGAAYTLAEVLRDAGYNTCGVIANGNLFPAFGFDQGFDSYLYGHNGAQSGSELALEWLRSGAGSPFFLWVHNTDPHAPYRPPGAYSDVFADEVEYGRHSLDISKSRVFGAVHPTLVVEGPLDLGYYISQYDGEIAYTDHWMGELLSGLRARGHDRNTLVVFTADHGESLGEHEYYFKHGLLPYEASARIPLVLSLPGVIGRGVGEGLIVESVNIMPTILELLGMDVPPSCQGESLLEMVGSLTDPDATGAGDEVPSENSRRASSARNSRGASSKGAPDGTAEPSRYAYIEAGYGHHTGPGYTFAMTDGRYKLIARDIGWVVRPGHVKRFIYTLNTLFEGGATGHELYDLASDPGETNNLIDELPGEAGRLRAELDAFLARMKEDGTLPPDVGQRALDEQTLRSLRSLGYVQ